MDGSSALIAWTTAAATNLMIVYVSLNSCSHCLSVVVTGFSFRLYVSSCQTTERQIECEFLSHAVRDNTGSTYLQSSSWIIHVTWKRPQSYDGRSWDRVRYKTMYIVLKSRFEHVQGPLYAVILIRSCRCISLQSTSHASIGDGFPNSFYNHPVFCKYFGRMLVVCFPLSTPSKRSIFLNPTCRFLLSASCSYVSHVRWVKCNKGSFHS